ncbi:hypothetical protein PANT111_160084 [Pantoea brenneri]|uniref:Uncharacterized protein n=1 Tax=Pantoea brenneri TaxID=472694 RepID=A0AAX3J3T5_9GAMM|nr:hypothetical protein PANT111_160084 [Pantoea brenneri]
MDAWLAGEGPADHLISALSFACGKDEDKKIPITYLTVI